MKEFTISNEQAKELAYEWFNFIIDDIKEETEKSKND